MDYENVYDFITREQNLYQTTGVRVADNYEWSMWKHIQTTILYKNSQYAAHVKKDDEPFKNIIRPILNLQYRAEGFDVKDIELYVNEQKNYYKSFLVKKRHETWARENAIDTFIDDLVETYIDFGGALVKDVNDVKPEVVPWPRIAFVDQTDVLSGPICEKHFFSSDQLQEMKSKGWGDKKKGATSTIDEVITLARNSKKDRTGEQKTPSKYIEVYELHGVFPAAWLLDGEDAKTSDSSEYVRQLHIVTFYQDKETNEKKGICLFKGKERELPYKLVLRDKMYGRALGIGGAEELFEPQVWVNYDVIRMKGMLDQAAKIIYKTTDASLANRNKTANMENGEILILEDGKDVSQLNTQPVNITVFENSVKEWEIHAQQMASATDALMGEAPSAGTPFKLQDLITQEGQGMHEYRKGKLATFLDEIYRDWVIPYIAKDITKGTEFLADLTLEELQTIAETVATNQTNRAIVEQILSGQVPDPNDLSAFKDHVRQTFVKAGPKKFVEILKDELKDAPLSVKVNIAGKQKHLSQVTDKLTNIFRTVMAAPQILQNPAMAKLFNQILESSGLDPVDFSGFTRPSPQPQTLPAPQAQTTPQPVAAGAPA